MNPLPELPRGRFAAVLGGWRERNPCWREVMKLYRILTAVGSCLLFVGVVARAEEKDPAAALAKAPKAVQAAAKKALGDKKLEELDKENVGGKVLYEVGFKVGGVDHAYIINEAGEVLQEEADVEVSKLPAAVTAAVKKAQPECKIDEAAEATAGEHKFYVVDVKVGKDTHALKIKADGTLIADDVEKPVSDEKDEK
jgi:hypothetical protein